MRTATPATAVRSLLAAPLVLSLLLPAVVFTLPGCGESESKKTGAVIGPDPDAAVRQKEMENYMKTQKSGGAR